jgi:hypothetical protein
VFSPTIPNAILKEFQHLPITVTAEPPTPSTAKEPHPSNSSNTLLRANTSNTRPRAKATLPKAKATHPRASKATRNSSPTASRPSPSVLPHPWAHHPQCPPGGSSNGTRAASAGTTSSKRRAAHSGTPPRTYRPVRMRRRRLAPRTRRLAGTMSAACLATRRATRDMITLPRAPRRMRRRRRKTRADTRLLCLLRRVSVV